MRWATPVNYMKRVLLQDVEIHGKKLRAGEQLAMFYASANRDEDVFADSMNFDVTRTEADRLLSFGVGAHFCLGAQFARRELRTFLRRLVDQVASIEPAGDAEWAQSHFVSGVKHLPIRYRWR